MFPQTCNINRRPTPLRRGLGMVEALISLAIAATLLTAVGVAFNASADAISMIEALIRPTQAARVRTAGIMTLVGRAAVDAKTTSSNRPVITEGVKVTSFK